MPDKEKIYVVHGADTKCNMGLRTSKVVLRLSHGVFLKKIAQITDNDCKGDINIINFCGCLSADNPKTQEMAKKISAEVEENTGISFDEQVMDIFCTGSIGSVKTMGCAGECVPMIVSAAWDEVNDTVFTEGKKPVKGTAVLKCQYGGVITIELEGQPEG